MTVEWTVDHLPNLINKFSELLEEDALTDITILTENQQQFQAHKVILAANSGYFKSMFTLDFKEKGKKEVIIESVDGDILIQLLKFCYSGELDLTDEGVLGVTEAAFYLQIETAVQLCFDFTTSKSTRDDVQSHFSVLCKAAIMADEHVHTKGFDMCIETMPNWFMVMYKTEMFKKLMPYEILCKLLERSDLTKKITKETGIPDDIVDQWKEKPKEDQVLEAVVGWLKYDWETRKVHMASLLNMVRLGTIDTEVADKLMDKEMQELEVYQKVLELKGSNLALAKPSDREIFCPRDMTNMLIAWETSTYQSIDGSRCLRLYAYFFDFYNGRRKKDGSIPWPMFQDQAPDNVASLISEPQFMTVAVLSNHLYLCTGFSGHVFQLNLHTFQWKPLDFRHPSSQCAVVYHDGWLYALDGYHPDIDRAGEYTQRARRYHLLNRTAEDITDNLPDPDELHDIGHPSAVTQKGHIIMYGHDEFNVEGADMTQNTHKLVIYNPSKNEWHVIYQERHNTHTESTLRELYSALVKCDNKVYRVIYQSNQVTPGTFKDTPQVNELVLDLESKPPTCQIGAPQDQSTLCDDKNDIQYQGEFCINNELYLNVKGCIIRTGYVMTGDVSDVATRKKWRLVYQDINTAKVAFGPFPAHDMWDIYDDEHMSEEN